MDELDRILERDDVLLRGAVDVVDHRRERGALARARAPCHEHEPAGRLGEDAHRVGQAERIELQMAARDASDDRAEETSLEVEMNAEPPERWLGESHVDIA